MSLLTYWEAHSYSVAMLTLTTCPESQPATELSYSHQRLRQRVERARLAVGDDRTRQLGHIDELEYAQIRTSEGPQGVIHAFWAWDRDRFRDGNHDRELFVPQSWLSDQWADIHGSEVPLEPDELELWPESAAGHMERLTRDRAPFVVDIQRLGPDQTEKEHDVQHVASYVATQYLGDHGDALEHLSWSHGRSMGGSVADTWTEIKRAHGTLDAAVDVWQRVMQGEQVAIQTGGESSYVTGKLLVNPPPDLGYSFECSVSPPDDWEPASRDAGVRRESYTADTEPDTEQAERVRRNWKAATFPEITVDPEKYVLLSSDRVESGAGGRYVATHQESFRMTKRRTNDYEKARQYANQNPDESAASVAGATGVSPDVANRVVSDD